MPKISYFFGITISIYYNEHNPPHLHAVYNECKATYEIKSGKKIRGEMSKTAERLIKKWIKLKQKDLLRVWILAQNKISPLPSVDPLE